MNLHLEMKKDGCLSLMGRFGLISKSGDGITTSVHRKPTDPGRDLKYDSYHPEHVKLGRGQNFILEGQEDLFI